MFWTIASWITGVLGVGVVLYALFWDRPGWRGRAKLRCRKCFYDLTATPGDLKIEPIRCPECGKKHPSRRSMRKTRRSKKWIMIALGLLLAAYGAQITPKVQRHGWGAAFPDTFLVASFPFLSEEPGTGLSTGILSPAYGITQSGYEAFVLKQAGDALSGWSGSLQPTNRSWLSKRLVFLLARMESEEVLTDVTTLKGNVYSSFITKAVRSHEVFEYESAWANSVIHFEFDTGSDIAPSSVIYSSFRSRRLVKGQYRLSLGWRQEMFLCNSPSSLWMNGRHPNHTTNDEALRYWVDRFAWDSHYRVTKDGVMYSSEHGAILAIGVSQAAGQGPSESDIRYAVYEPDHMSSEKSSFYEVARGEAVVPYQTNQDRVPILDSSQELKDFIDSKLRAKFTLQYDRLRNKWVPVVKLSSERTQFLIDPEPLTQSELEAYQSTGDYPVRMFERHERVPPLLEGGLIFGGKVSIKIIWNLENGPYETTILTGPETWWRWGLPDSNASDNTPPRPDRALAIQLRGVSKSTDTIAGEVQRGGGTPARYENTRYQVVVKVEPQPQPMWQDFGGLWAGRVYTGTIEFPINDWNVDELRAFIVSGVVPEHAMP